MMFMGLLNVKISVQRLKSLIEQHEQGRAGLLAMISDAKDSRATALATIGEELTQLDSLSKQLR